jgi:tRNA pseudouridine55 synthase
MPGIIRGLFAVWKPPEILSASVVATIKRIILKGGQDVHSRVLASDTRLKVGHGGTLDNLAEGVLVIGVGRDCKRLGYYTTSTTKQYEVTCRLGLMTDTLDAAGVVTEEATWDHIRLEDVEGALGRFRGVITQTPPLFSALKYKGERLSDLAIKAREECIAMPVAPKPRTVTIHSIELLRFEPPQFTIAVTCSSGTYMRSLVRDISTAVGSVGHALSVIRRQQGMFTEEMALRKQDWSVERISQAIELADRVDGNNR